MIDPQHTYKGIDTHTLFSYGGDGEVVVRLIDFSIDTLASSAREMKEKGGVYHRKLGQVLFSLMIEMGQNILIHSSQEKSGALLVKETPASFLMLSCNPTTTAAAKVVANRCKLLNYLGQDEITSFYREKLALPRKKGQKGGEVGLVLLSRKSRNPIHCTSKTLDSQTSLLCLGITLDKKY